MTNYDPRKPWIIFIAQNFFSSSTNEVTGWSVSLVRFNAFCNRTEANGQKMIEWRWMTKHESRDRRCSFNRMKAIMKVSALSNRKRKQNIIVSLKIHAYKGRSNALFDLADVDSNLVFLHWKKLLRKISLHRKRNEWMWWLMELNVNALSNPLWDFWWNWYAVWYGLCNESVGDIHPMNGITFDFSS